MARHFTDAELHWVRHLLRAERRAAKRPSRVTRASKAGRPSGPQVGGRRSTPRSASA